MKKILNVGIGGRSFVIDEDAYSRLNDYLESFRRKTRMGVFTKEVMDDLEMRIAEIFSDSLSSKQEVVNIALVEKVIDQLGVPDGSAEDDYYDKSHEPEYKNQEPRKLYRDIDNNVFGGVCSGLAHFFNIDTAVLRIFMVCAFLFGGFGFWLYIILWIVVPAARTSAEKCRMYGIPANAENMRRFYKNTK